jgi:hypothetical protein
MRALARSAFSFYGGRRGWGQKVDRRREKCFFMLANSWPTTMGSSSMQSENKERAAFWCLNTERERGRWFSNRKMRQQKTLPGPLFWLYGMAHTRIKYLWLIWQTHSPEERKRKILLSALCRRITCFSLGHDEPHLFYGWQLPKFAFMLARIRITIMVLLVANFLIRCRC